MKKGEIADHGVIAEYRSNTGDYSQWMDRFWRSSTKVDHPAFDGIQITAKTRASKKLEPTFLLENLEALRSSVQQWWPMLEQRIKDIMKKRKIDNSGDLHIMEISVGFPKESIENGARWNMEIEVEEIYGWFSVRFESMSISKIYRSYT